MKILIIGGTLFLGRHIVDTALKNGHEVTLFNRGKTNPDLFPEVEKIKGDRDSDLELLKGRKWDAVIDTCGYIPRIVAKSAKFLSENVGTYVFISTISVFKDFSEIGITENSGLATLEDESVEDLTNETYGALKTHCEERVMKHCPDNNLIIRPGLIVGPNDYSDRLTYWPYRIRQGGEVVIPEVTDYPIQFIDVRDLADFTIKLVENEQNGIFNVTGPEEKFTFQQLLNSCMEFTKENVEFIKLPYEFMDESLAEYKVYLPILEARGEWAGIEKIDCSKAIKAGLVFRDVRSTIEGALGWMDELTEPYKVKVGLTPEIEKKIIEKWRS